MATPIDPLDGPKFVIEGRVVTMDANSTVIDTGRVVVGDGGIVAVTAQSTPVPDGYGDAPVIQTKGTIYPGLIELHNHLSYDIIPMWQVPQAFRNRDQWSGRDDYRTAVTGPMGVLGKTVGYIEAIVRYVETKCLVAGTTTSQGITLQSNQSIQHHYRGVVRNVEQTTDPALPNASTRVADVPPGAAPEFLTNLEKNKTVLLHLSEGVDPVARSRFENLRIPPRKWAITPALAGIHCTALQSADFKRLGSQGGAMVWSPFSNLLLYGQTANVPSARAAGVDIALGSDWSPSGSKNLLAELKVAELVNLTFPKGKQLTPEQLVAMVTINPARILKWDAVIGSIEPGKRADLLVLDGTTGDPYQLLIDADEAAVSLVTINGVPRYGHPRFLTSFDASTEAVTIGATTRALFLKQTTGDPVVGALTLSEATSRLADGLQRLPELAKGLHTAAAVPGITARGGGDERWVLELDHNEGPLAGPHMAAAPPPTLEPVTLDSLTIANDGQYAARIAAQPNLPAAVKKGLVLAFGG
jgi:cytosine/adenosine deaminase-related metal-dependent hydrolase